MMKAKKKNGFTLVEILIVVVIMAVLAAAIIPQFTDSTEDAKSSTSRINLQTLRSQIQVYAAHHNDAYPTVADFARQLTTETDVDGAAIAANDTTTKAYGPYLPQIPENPFNNSATVQTTDATTTPTIGNGTTGWMYNPDTGQIWINEANHLNH